jgi:hypothetical protein
MSAKHTPGPWELKSEGWKGQFIYGTDEHAKGVRFIAKVSLDFDGAEANARLIAAAPELLEALKGLDEAYCRAGTLSKSERLEDRKRLMAARAAIAKATGETL